MRLLLALCFVISAGAGCAERRLPGPQPPSDTGAPAPAPSLAAVADSASAIATAPDASAPAAPGSWIEAVRLEQWSDAAARIDALPESARNKPEMRYVRARAAVGMGDGKRALSLLEDLERALPLLVNDIQRWRAEAQLLAGPYAAAAAYFAKSRSSRDLVRAADAYEKAGDTGSARATIDRAVATAGRGKGPRDEAIARMKRAEIFRAHGGDGAAEPDLRWVATHAAGTPEGRAAVDALEKMKRPLTPKERVTALDGIDPTGSGSAPNASMIERMAKEAAPAGAKPPSRGELLHARAMALFRAREYNDAAKAFREASAVKSGHEAEDLHYAGRSLARANRDEEAVKTYREVVARWPKSAFAEKSAYYAARLELQDGHFKEAEQAYTRYLATYKKGDHRDEAEYERAVARLSSGDAAEARKTLSGLAKKARDDRAGRLRELEGLAADRAGDRPGAIAIWTELARLAPLTWGALTARARLAAIGAPLPPLMEPEVSGKPHAPLDLRLPQAPALLASVGLDGDAETYLLGSEREAAAIYTGRENEALCGLYGMLSRAKRRYRVGINAVDASWLYRAPAASERWAWDCVYPRPFASGVRALEEQHGIPRGLVHAVMRQESAFDPAIVSPANAVGLMQLMPATARQAATEVGLTVDEADLVRPDVNLKLGAFYIAKLLRMWKGHVALAAAAYNAGPRVVSHWVESGADNDLDLWVARIPFDETRNYVARVVQNLARYQWLEGGDAAVMPVSLTLPADARAPADAY
jgi:soluble lytic murein transglycosylase